MGRLEISEKVLKFSEIDGELQKKKKRKKVHLSIQLFSFNCYIPFHGPVTS